MRATPTHAAPQPTKPGPRTAARDALTKGDRLLIAGVLAVVLAGGAAYVFRSELVEQYERFVHPDRYWSKKVKSLRFNIAFFELEHQGCLIDLDAARRKEPILAAKNLLYGISSDNARSWAADETAAQENLCGALLGSLKLDRERLAVAERELARLRPK